MAIRVFAAIDFGTHGTGYSWAFVDERNADRFLRDVDLCYSWPAAPEKYPKNLTALLIDTAGRVEAWGWEAAERNRNEDSVQGLRYVSGFKMSLGTGRRSKAGLILAGADRTPERVERQAPGIPCRGVRPVQVPAEADGRAPGQPGRGADPAVSRGGCPDRRGALLL